MAAAAKTLTAVSLMLFPQCFHNLVAYGELAATSNFLFTITNSVAVMRMYPFSAPAVLSPDIIF